MRENFKRKIIKVCAIAFSLVLIVQMCTFAKGTSESYTYNAHPVGNSSDCYWDYTASADAYSLDKVITGSDLGIGNFSNPDDLCVYNNEIYLLDKNKTRSRIVVMDENLQLKRVINPTKEDGTDIKWFDPKGIFISKDEKIYVADKGDANAANGEDNAAAVFVLDMQGKQVDRINRPDSDIVGDTQFTPSKVLVDASGLVNVMCEGTYKGLWLFDKNNDFISFYGTEKVVATPEIVLKQLMQKILSKEARSAMKQSIPTTINSIDIDNKGFIYTTKSSVSGGKGGVKKLNSLGTDILKNYYGSEGYYGDMGVKKEKSGTVIATNLVDVCVDDDGFITVVDRTKGHVFQYDQSGNPLFVFGGKSRQKGNFKTAIACESINDSILVLDEENSTITKFDTTDFGKSVRKATMLFNNGQYQESMEPWLDALKYDSNYEMANIGLGKAYTKLGDLKKAKEYYKIGQDYQGYSLAFAQSRDDMLKQHFPIVFACVVLVLLVPVLIIKWKQKHRKSEYDIKVKKSGTAFYCLWHPFKGYLDMKYDKNGSLLSANIILVAWFVSEVFTCLLLGFQFHPVSPDDFNIVIILLRTVVAFALWAICNWGLSTLFNGEGTFKEVWIFSAYAILPMVIGNFVIVILSNVLSLDEAAFISIIGTVFTYWTYLAVLMSVKECHQYTVGQTLLLIIFTLVGMMLVLALIAIVYTLFMKLILFVTTIINELALR